MSRWWILAVAAVVALAVACGPAPTPEPKKPPVKVVNEKPKAPKGHVVKTAKLPQGMVGKNVTLSGFYEDEEPLDPNAKQVGDYPTRHGKEVKHDVYKLVAPATVIVSTPRGYGSGVIYHKDGWILTNHHVIAHGKRVDFRQEVKIRLGKLGKSGVMEKDKKVYKAYVHKIDPMLDLAVVKLVNPPKDLATVAIAGKDPTPGQKVSSLGHAGIGLIWAIKDGQIAAMGKLSEQLAQLLLIESAGKDKSASPLHKSRAKRAKKRMEEYKKFLEKKKPALVIQSTCPISQGDSGGPLVNGRGEIVGINAFVRRVRGAGKESNFHIHVAEVRKFIKDMPQEAPQLIPDPWTEGGEMAKMGDADMDSKVDVLVLHKLARYRFWRRLMPKAYFFDLDQDSFKDAAKLPKLKEVVEKKSYEAEWIFLESGSLYLAWYDTDNNGKMDVLLVASGYRRQEADGYRIDAKGKLTKDKALKAGPLVRPQLFSDEAMKKRLLASAARLFSSKMLPRGTVMAKAKYPDPIAGVGHKGTLRDYNYDRKPDTIVAGGMFSRGYVFDADQDSLGSFKVGASLHAVRKSHKIDAELSWITQKRANWVWYDTNNDGKFDLLLHSTNKPTAFVDEAWTVGADGKYAPVKDQVGRKMIQPELVAGQADAIRKLTRRALGTAMVAAGPGAKAFPDPTRYYSFGMKLVDVKRMKKAAAKVRRYRCSQTLVDVDLNTKKLARKEKKSVLDMVRKRKFDAEFVHIACGSKHWAFYDTRGKGTFDVIVFSSKSGRGKPTIAYVVDKEGKITVRKKPINCDGVIQPRLFKNRRLARNFKKMAYELFSNVADKKCKP